MYERKCSQPVLRSADLVTLSQMQGHGKRYTMAQVSSTYNQCRSQGVRVKRLGEMSIVRTLSFKTDRQTNTTVHIGLCVIQMHQQKYPTLHQRQKVNTQYTLLLLLDMVNTKPFWYTMRSVMTAVA